MVRQKLRSNPTRHDRKSIFMADSRYSPLRWGILGPGSIARRFSNDVKNLDGHKLMAVGSRDAAKADTFANEYEIPNRHGSYEALVSDPEVDVVYVATPHTFHKEHSLLALTHGKPVLCEKPFTINRGEAEAVVAEARKRGLFLMEGMWSRCFPIMVKLRELLKEGAIGELRMAQADFGFRAGVNPESRLFNPALGGGALMDVGVYTVSLASMVLGTPTAISSESHLGSTGVDEDAGMVFKYADGQIALLSTSVRLNTPHEVVLLGTEGRIKIQSPWWCPRAMTVSRSGQPDERIEIPFEGGGFQFEAEHVAACLRAGKTESDIIPLDETLSIMATLDTLRAQFGLKYPME
jgi:predicted dehydrogenase